MCQRSSSAILGCTTPESYVLPTCAHLIPSHMLYALAHEQESSNRTQANGAATARPFSLLLLLLLLLLFVFGAGNGVIILDACVISAL